jgi:hypothetical protein
MNMIDLMNAAPDRSLENYITQIKEGLILEFGVATGETINKIAKATENRTVYGFDSFEGLPEDWRPDQGIKKGAFAGPIPNVLPNVQLVVGLFSDTLPKFVQEHTEPVAFIHVDCDLYSSTKCIFDNLKDKMQDGTIIAFDEIRAYQGFEQHEYKAFNEFLEENKYQWECIGQHGGEKAGFKIYK